MLTSEQTAALDAAIAAWNRGADLDAAAFTAFDDVFGPDSRKLFAAFVTRQRISGYARGSLALVLELRGQTEPDYEPSGDGLGTVSTMAEPA